MQIKFKDFIFYKYEIENWKNIKVKLLETCEKCNEHFLDNVITNWNTSKEQKEFLKNKISNILHHQIDIFKKENNLFLYKLDSAWFQKYKKGMNHDIHNHGYGGYSAIIYINYNSKYHYPTTFIDKHTKEEFYPNVKEGDIIFFNSIYNHYCPPNNDEKTRIICSFNLKLSYN
jgi:hypothetical protein